MRSYDVILLFVVCPTTIPSTKNTVDIEKLSRAKELFLFDSKYYENFLLVVISRILILQQNFSCIKQNIIRPCSSAQLNRIHYGHHYHGGKPGQVKRSCFITEVLLVQLLSKLCLYACAVFASHKPIDWTKVSPNSRQPKFVLCHNKRFSR